MSLALFGGLRSTVQSLGQLFAQGITGRDEFLMRELRGIFQRPDCNNVCERERVE